MKLLIFVFVTALSSTVAFAQNLSYQHKEEWGKEKGSSTELFSFRDSRNTVVGSSASAAVGIPASSVVARPSRLVSPAPIAESPSSAGPKAVALDFQLSDGPYDHHDEKKWNAGIDVGYVWNQSDWGRDNTNRSHPDIDERNDGTDFGFDLNLQRAFGAEGPFRNMWFVELAYMYNRHSGISPTGDGYGGSEAARALTQKSYRANAHSFYVKGGANLLQLANFVTEEIHRSWSMDLQTGVGILFNSGNRVFGAGEEQRDLQQWSTQNLVIPIELELVHTLNENWAVSAELYTVYIPGDLYDGFDNGDRDAIIYLSIGVRRHFEWF